MSIDVYAFLLFLGENIMGKYKNKAYTLRIDNDLMDKVRKVAEKEHRKISDQLEMIIEEYINNYESKNGNIVIGEINQSGKNNTINF